MGSNALWRRRGLMMGLGLLGWTKLTRAADPTGQPLDWAALMPPGWNPMKAMAQETSDLSQLSDNSARAQALMREMRAAWDNAPTRPELDGRALRLSGYVVPLDRPLGPLRELLLVPYFGACIHTPPPPANQIVHVILAKPHPLRSMEAVTVSGVLRVRRATSSQGVSGYAIEGGLAESYASGASR